MTTTSRRLTLTGSSMNESLIRPCNGVKGDLSLERSRPGWAAPDPMISSMNNVSTCHVLEHVGDTSKMAALAVLCSCLLAAATALLCAVNSVQPEPYMVRYVMQYLIFFLSFLFLSYFSEYAVLCLHVCRAISTHRMLMCILQ